MNKMSTLFDQINKFGIAFVFQKSVIKLTQKKIPFFSSMNKMFHNKIGLEIGGPSSIFKDEGFVPLYRIACSVDGCNFSNSTIWEGKITSGKTYNYYKQEYGIQYISEATDLSFISSSSYDFVISSNCLEHIANPLKAVEEWLRVLNSGGLMFLVLPNKKYNFDHKRQFTEFSHILDDYNNNIQEDDLTHLNEILKLHDLNMDKPAGSLDQFRERSLNNFENRALHHHVFDIDLLKSIFYYFKLEVLYTYEGQEFMILGKKTI